MGEWRVYAETWEEGSVKNIPQRHPNLPNDEDRHAAILALARSVDGKVPNVVQLPQHLAKYARSKDGVRITYTPHGVPNRQTSDFVRASTCTASSL